VRFIVSDDMGELRRFNWLDEAKRFIGGNPDLTLTKLPKSAKQDPYIMAQQLLGEALI
jgi:hypothetical protein